MVEVIGEGCWIRRYLVVVAVAVVVVVAGSGLLSARAAAAAEPETPPKEDVRVWYRSSEGCPDGSAFIELLSRLGRGGSLAGVGDRVDFVVTVAHAPEQSTGHLERQSSDRTVAIRDARAASCAEVAEVLALSIDLALAPASSDAAVEPSSPLANRDGGWEYHAGAQGTLTTGVAHTALLGAAAFIDLRPAPDPWSLRLSLRGALGKRDAAVPLDLSLFASRLEACWTWSMGQLELGPCGGVELGWLRAEAAGAGARTDTGLWSSAVAHARASWQLGPVLALEARAGLLVPFVRYRFDALTGGEVSDSAALGVEGALGLSFRL